MRLNINLKKRRIWEGTDWVSGHDLVLCGETTDKYFAIPKTAKSINLIISDKKTKNSYKVKYNPNTDILRFLDIETRGIRKREPTFWGLAAVVPEELYNKVVYVSIEV